MFSFVPLATAALLGLASADTSGAINPATKLPVEYVWAVSHWVAGGARAGSSYDFNVSAEYVANSNPEYPPGKHFFAYCSGLSPYAGPDVVSFYQPCKLFEGGSASDGLQVAAYLEPYDLVKADGVARIHVSLEYLDLTYAKVPTTRNYSGSYDATFNQVSAPAYDFTIVPNTLVSYA
ncbi:hypothetical protein Tdes44962_MAKER07136 [Teratosphaeria destructans]|uniref:Uncharacterized protein n=1 Tax=Teratosphaeria destructans TaxID=418781 RepID=A0A9W7SZY5_9PEZI|nr:hypothetical protein Tdes44962_MAKER07136 [Teratosphaeria destructans]